MINHLRTLLANISPTAEAPGLPSGTFVDPDFIPLVLPYHLDRTRAILIGKAADGWKINYRLAEMLAVLRSTRMAEHEFRFDSRVTYETDPRDAPADLISQEFGTTVTAGNIATLTANIYPSLIGDMPLTTAGDPLLWTWNFVIAAKSSDEVVVTGNCLRPTNQAFEYVLALTSGLSEPFRLPGSLIDVLVPATVVEGYRWTVRSLLRPAVGLVAALEIVANSGQQVLGPFFADPIGEPSTSFANMWKSGKFALQLAGLMLEYQEQAEALRSESVGQL